MNKWDKRNKEYLENEELRKKAIAALKVEVPSEVLLRLLRDSDEMWGLIDDAAGESLQFQTKEVN